MSLAKNISEGMEEAIGAVPSYAELDTAIENIGQTLDILDMGEFPHTDKSYG
ncbi:jg565, partial [Pararge aegeria aegeria]